MPFSWSPDGDVLAYGESGDIRLFNLDGNFHVFYEHALQGIVRKVLP